jgi:hypothetical protein
MWLWYEIETNWDYAYVEVSTDGSTFTPLAGNVTTDYDPYGQNKGNGITGDSDGWTEAFFDLADYVGQSVYLRLSYETDSWVSEAGIWFDDIYPLDGFEFETVVSSTLQGDRYTFYDKPNGEYFYKVRAQDADDQWSRFSPTVATVAIGEEVCFDSDGDGFGDPDHPENTCPDDNCPVTYNDDQADGDSDGVGDVCDNCPEIANAGQDDADADEIGDLCDICPNDADNDADADGWCADEDNCPEDYNPDQTVSGGLSMGDACCCAVRGDMNHDDGLVDISDLVRLVNYMFQDGVIPECPEEGNVDGTGGMMDIADLVYLVNYMFQDGPVPPACS